MGIERTDEDLVLTDGRANATAAEIARRSLAAQLRAENIALEQLTVMRAILECLTQARPATLHLPADPAAPLDPHSDPGDLATATERAPKPAPKPAKGKPTHS